MIVDALAAVLAVCGALYALGARQLMRGVLGLAVFFTGIAIFFASLGAWYLAIGQVFLFVGGVVTLFVLAFNMAPAPVQKEGIGASALVAVAILGVLAFFLPEQAIARDAVPLADAAGYFFANYGVALLVVILLLFSAIIGAQYVMAEDDA